MKDLICQKCKDQLGHEIKFNTFKELRKHTQFFHQQRLKSSKIPVLHCEYCKELKLETKDYKNINALKRHWHNRHGQKLIDSRILTQSYLK